MPPYGDLLGNQAVDSLVDLLFGEFIRIKRDDKRHDLPVPPKPAIVLAQQKTEKEYTKHCSICHGVGGNGKGPEYLKYLPRPRDLTNHPYFGSLFDERIVLAIAYGVPSTGMQPFIDKIPPETIWALMKKIREFSGKDGKFDKSIG